MTVEDALPAQSDISSSSVTTVQSLQSLTHDIAQLTPIHEVSWQASASANDHSASEVPSSVVHISSEHGCGHHREGHTRQIGNPASHNDMQSGAMTQGDAQLPVAREEEQVHLTRCQVAVNDMHREAMTPPVAVTRQSPCKSLDITSCQVLANHMHHEESRSIAKPLPEAHALSASMPRDGKLRAEEVPHSETFLEGALEVAVHAIADVAEGGLAYAHKVWSRKGEALAWTNNSISTADATEDNVFRRKLRRVCA